MNDKKEYKEKILPDGLNLIQFRVKRALDSAERELKRGFYLISKDINGFKSDAKNIKTEEEKMALLYRINSSKSTINVILEERPLLKDFVTNIKIDGKILTKLGYGSKVFEIMRERERSQMEAFQKELLKLEDEVMSIDFSGNESPQIEEEINVTAGLLEFFLGPDNNNNDDKKDYKDEKEYKERNAKEFLKECKGKSAKSIARSYKTRSGKGLVKNYEQYRVKKLLYDELVNLRLISDIKPATFRTYFYK